MIILGSGVRSIKLRTSNDRGKLSKLEVKMSDGAYNDETAK